MEKGRVATQSSLEISKKRNVQNSKNKIGPVSDGELSIIHQLIEARKKVGFTQAELAGRMKMHQPAIARIERGVIATSAKRLAQYADAVGQVLVLKPKKR